MPEVSDMFKRVDATKKLYIKTQSPEEAEERKIPHIVRLPAGAAPEYIKLTPYQQLAWKLFGKRVTSRMKPDQNLDENLLKAHMRIRPEEYMAVIWLTAAIAAVAGLGAGLILAILIGAAMSGSSALLLQTIVIVMPALAVPILIFVVMKSTPSSKMKKIGRDIDKRLPAAMSFISAMASADVNIDVIFKELARQPIYGEIRVEAEWITRDTELLGIDILTAIKKSATRTPSKKFQDFLQGVITTSTSGGQLKPYFLLKAEEYETEQKLEMKAMTETLGLLAESFVVVVVAFPLFLVLILAIMALVGGNSGSTLMILYLVVFLMIPISQFGFIFVIWNSEKESAV
ncbi:MAG TPA: type II secretion protein F [Euryarchaeota archaeon]|nr:type II secretion protein F [Euryarchaeota archaeon]